MMFEKKIYYSPDEEDLVYRAKSLGWRFIRKIDGSLEGIPPEKEAVDRNIKKLPTNIEEI